MADDWSAEEVAATVADYFVMLGHELRGEVYNKRDHNRNLQSMLRDRSAGAIEFKHANISAVLIELGFPYIIGYKRRGNYQELLREEVIAQLDVAIGLQEAAAQAVMAPVVEVPMIRSLSDIIVPIPVRESERQAIYERRALPEPSLRRINYLEREARNSSLGIAGELFALEVEHRRLWEAGRKDLAERIEHVALTQGDGLGYDILSYEPNGAERLIEVKTTAFGQMTPFFASKKEVIVSENRAQHYQLYRVFKFRQSPRVFVLSGSLRQSCVLDPIAYRASLL